MTSNTTKLQYYVAVDVKRKFESKCKLLGLTYREGLEQALENWSD